MRFFSTALVLGFLLTAIASAETIYPPQWRGEENTTYQAWTFDNNNNPADLDPANDNPYGTPTATINDFVGLTYWLPTYNAAGSTETAEGIWKLYGGNIVLDIPNTENTSPYSFKEIWLQITYYDPGGFGYDLPLGVEPIYDSLERLDRETLDTNFYCDLYQIIIRPNPLRETLTITPIQCQLYVDAISVDTRCVPEPSVLVLLAMGLGFAFFRHKAAN